MDFVLHVEPRIMVIVVRVGEGCLCPLELCLKVAPAWCLGFVLCEVWVMRN